MRKVIEIKKKKGYKNIYNIIFEDGQVVDLSDESIIKNGIKEQKYVDDENIGQAINESQYFIGREKAYRYIEKGNRSLSELKRYLIDIGLEQKIVEDIIGVVIDNKIIDERLIIESYISSCLRKKQGNLKIKYDLMMKGFHEEDIDELVSLVEDETLYNNAFRLAHEKITLYSEKDKRNPHKLARFLIGQGYEEDIVEKVINRFYNIEDSL